MDGYSNTNSGTFTPTQRLPRSSSQESLASQGQVLSSSDLISMLDKVMELVESGFDDNDDLQWDILNEKKEQSPNALRIHFWL